MTTSPIQLIVGLANPGKEYERTRHNAGSWWVERILSEANTALKAQSKFHGKYADFKLSGHAVHCLIPTTYMNVSGIAVRAISDYYDIEPASILIAHDEIDLETGDIRLKFSGGDGGHNGLKDIIRHLSTRDFYRLRIGVGRPSHSREVVDYVLEAPSQSEKKCIDAALDRALEQLPVIVEGDIQRAMNVLHGK